MWLVKDIGSIEGIDLFIDFVFVMVVVGDIFLCYLFV